MRRGAQDGFVLPAVLWITAALALIAAVTTQWVSAGVENARQRQIEVEAERKLFETQSIVLYQLATSYLTARGLETGSSAQLSAPGDPFQPLAMIGRYVGLDDRPYLLNGVEVRLQDCRGLLNLNLATDDEVFRLLGLLGVPLEARGPLIAKLRDYISTGDLMRLNGAKRNEYLAAGRRPPSYLPLVTPYEAMMVLDWDKYPNLWAAANAIPSLTTTAGAAVGVNLNTAPAAVASIVEGMTPAAVEKLVRGRVNHPILSIVDVQAVSGVSVLDNPLRYIFFPADSIRIRLHLPGRALERVMVVHLTPQAVPNPWRIDYSIDVPPLSNYDADPPAEPFPLSTSASVSLAQ